MVPSLLRSILLVLLLALCGLSAAGPAEAALRELRTGLHDGFGRLVLEFDRPVAMRATVDGNRMAVVLDQALPAELDGNWRRLSRWLLAAKSDADGLSLTLADGVRAKAAVLDRRLVVIDFRAIAAPDGLKLRSGLHPTFRRLVIEPLAEEDIVRQGRGRILLPAPLLPQGARALAALGIDGLAYDPASRALDLPADPPPAVAFFAPDMLVIDLPRTAGTPAEPLPLRADVIDAPPPPVARPPAIGAGAPDAPALGAGDPAPPLPARPPAAMTRSPSDRASPATGAAAIADASAQAPGEAPAAVPLPEFDRLGLRGERGAHGSEVVFDWPEPVPAVAFMRAGRLWVAFRALAGAVDADADSLKANAANLVRTVRQLPHPGATIFRFTPGEGIRPSLVRDGAIWRLRFAAGEVLKPAPRLDRRDEGGVLLPDALASVPVVDPLVGDAIELVFLRTPHQAMPEDRGFVDLALPRTIEGLYVETLSDALAFTPGPGGLAIDRPGGLRLSAVPATPPAPVPARPPGAVDGAGGMAPLPPRPPEHETAPAPPIEHAEADPDVEALDAAAMLAGAGGHPLAMMERQARHPLDLAAPATASPGDFRAARQALMRRLASASGVEEGLVLLDLARLHLAHGFAGEAALLLGRAREIAPTLAASEAMATAMDGLGGAAALLLGRDEEAARLLGDAAFDADREIALWRAVLLGREGLWDNAFTALERSAGTLERYDPALQYRLGLETAMIDLQSGRADPAFATLDALAALPLTKDQRDRLSHVEAIALARDGAVDEALERWARLEKEAGLPLRLKALNHGVAVALENGRISPKEALERLKATRLLWRGHDNEVALLRQLAAVELQAGEADDALATMKLAIARERDPARAKAIAGTMQTLVAGRLGEAADLPPLDALLVYRKYRELLPEGEEGEALVRRLAERLHEGGFPTVAAALLDRQLDVMGDRAPGERDPVVMALAEALLDDDRAERALRALDRLTVAPSAGPLDAPGSLKARALTAAGRPDAALDLLRDRPGSEAAALRLKAAFEAGDWQGAVEAGSLLAADDPALDEATLMRLVLAHDRLGQRAGIPPVEELAGAGKAAAIGADAALLRLLAAPPAFSGKAGEILKAAEERIAATREKVRALP